MAPAKTKPKTPAQEAPPELSVVHLHPEDVTPHPLNPRRDVTADEALVESVRATGVLEPLLVVPAAGTADSAGGWVLIAGHRRRDAAIRAGREWVPAVLRPDLDTEQDQLEAMLTENGGRRDLTPMEEATAFRQLELFGMKPAMIARRTGRPAAVVTSRLRLLKLDQRTQTRVHDGQVDIDQALAVAALPAAEQARVAKHMGRSSFAWELAAAQRRVEGRKAAEAEAKRLRDEGVREVSMPAGAASIWALDAGEHGMIKLSATFSADPSDHQAGPEGCLGFLLVEDEISGRRIEYVCTDPARHDDQLDDVRRDAAEQTARAQAEAERAAEQQALARGLRLAAVAGMFDPAPRGEALLERADLLLGALLPAYVAGLVGKELGFYQDAMGIEPGRRWAHHSGVRTVGPDLLDDHLAEVSTGSMPRRLRSLAALLAARHETLLAHVTRVGAADPAAIDDTAETSLLAYYALLGEAGYEQSEVDAGLPFLRPVAGGSIGGAEPDHAAVGGEAR